MAVKTYAKNIVRSIKESFGRFVAIFTITALGVGFLAGLLSTTPSMRRTIDNYYDEYDLPDIFLKSTYGFNDDDIAAVKSVAGIETVYPLYSVDTVAETGDDSMVARVQGLDFDNLTIGRFNLTEGRLPEKANEVVAEQGNGVFATLNLGDSVTLSPADDETFTETTLTVVGIVVNPYYMSTERESSTVGNGRVGTVLYGSEELFCLDVYTDMYLTVAGAKELDTYSDEYDELIGSITDALEPVADEREALRFTEIKNDAEAELADAEAEYNEKRADAEKELADAAAELDDAEREIADGKAELEDGRAELEENRQKLEDGEAELDDAAAELIDKRREIADAEDELAAGRAELADAETELDKQAALLADGRVELEDGLAQLAAAEAELESGAAEIESNRQLLESKRAELEAGEAQLADGYAQLDAAETELEAGERQLEANRAELETQRTALESGRAELEDGYAQLEAAAETLPEEQYSALKAELDAKAAELADAESQLAAGEEQLSNAEAELESGRAELEAGRAELDANASTLAAGRSELEAGEQQIADATSELEAGKNELEANRALLEDKQAELESGEAQIAEARRELESGKAELDAAAAEIADGKEQISEADKTLNDKRIELADGKAELESAEAELEEAEAELADAEKELADGRAEYEEKKAEAEAEFADAEAELDDARDEIARLKAPVWYILDRNLTTSYASFDQNVDKVAAIAQVFPVFFFLVAALVVLTTMTRMIEEERGQIGIMKALGYSPMVIMSKYIIYAGISSLLGSAAGLAVGLYVFPTILWNTYKIMYTFPPFELFFFPEIALTSSAVAIACTLAATFWAGAHILSEKPATLLLPRAPKAGKRVLLERITPIWRRLSFNYKVTARNIFRYKKRFFMTVIGIAGCTALLVTGFGLRDSIGDIASKQYNELTLYNLDITVNEPDEADISKLEKFADSGAVTDYMSVHSDYGKVKANGDSYDIYITVPEDETRFDDFMVLRERRGKKPLEFGGSSVILTEKVASLLEVSVGDSVELETSDGDTASFIVTGITENYVMSYAYLTESVFTEGFGFEPEYTHIWAKSVANTVELEDMQTTELLSLDCVESVSFTSSMSDSFETMLSKIDYIVVVLIICAGLLVFVVLYNLTNINIAEREKELATIKVLGFYDSEVAAYVYRETVALSIIGTIAGLLLGILLHRFVILTAEVSSVMFGRTIYAWSYIFSALITLAFSAIVCLFMSKRLSNIDMVDSMKAVD